MGGGDSPGPSGRKMSILDRAPFHHRATHTHTPHSLKLGQCRHASSHLWDVGGNERKPESPEKTYADMVRTCRLHKESGPGWELIFFFFSYQRYNELALKEMTLFEDLLYL